MMPSPALPKTIHTPHFGQIIHFDPKTPEGSKIWADIEAQCDRNGHSILSPDALGASFTVTLPGKEPLPFTQAQWFNIGSEHYLADGKEKKILNAVRLLLGSCISALLGETALDTLVKEAGGVYDSLGRILTDRQ